MASILIFVVHISLLFIAQPLCSSKDNNFTTYIIHMDNNFMPDSSSSISFWYDSLVKQQTSSNGLLYSYQHALHGFCASLTKTQLEKIQRVPGYVSHTESMTLKTHTTRTPDFLGLNAHKGLWAAYNFGKDVIIGLVDSGVWPESQSFNDQGIGPIPTKWKGGCTSAGVGFNASLCNKKLIGAKYFNKAYISKHGAKLVNSARDDSGHGTHTSSTAAGSPVSNVSYFGYARGTARGTAPMARLAIYKPIWRDEGDECDVLAAMDEAIKDGVDVLSLSLGIPGTYLYADPISIATFAAMERGIFVAAAAGNEGPALKTVKNPAPWVLTVAAGTMDRTFRGNLVLGSGAVIQGESLYVTNSSVKMLPLLYIGGCDNKDELRKVGRHKMVVCEEGHGKEGNVLDQIANVNAAKNVAAAVFICNSTYLDKELMPYLVFPYTYVDTVQGYTLKNYIKEHNTTAKAKILFQNTTVGLKAPKVAMFSSRGPYKQRTNILKPDLMAPGYRILASWPDNIPMLPLPAPEAKPIFGKFNLQSGTSMSTPIAAGVAALLMEAHPDWSPAAIRSALMTTADLFDSYVSPISEQDGSGSAASPLAMGAGHLNPNKALHPGLIYDAGVEDYLTYLCQLNMTNTHIQTITRRPSACPANISTSFQLNYPSFIAHFNETSAQVQRMFRTVTNVEDMAAVYHASVTPIDGFEIRILPNKLSFNSKKDKKVFKMIIRKLARSTTAIGTKFGYLRWVDTLGKHRVTSPIVLTDLTLD